MRLHNDFLTDRKTWCTIEASHIPITHNKETTMAVATERMATDLMNQTMESFAGAMRTGLKVQEETAKWWLEAIGDAGSITCMQKKAQEFVDNAVPTFQQN